MHISMKKTLLLFAMILGGFVFQASAVRASDTWPETLPNNGIPALVLSIDETEFQKVLDSKDHSYSSDGGSIRLFVPDGYRSEYTGEQLNSMPNLELDYIRGRGNSTWRLDKKPFKFKLSKNIPKKNRNLLGMGSNRHWVLLANAYDDSLLKNRLVGYMGKELGLDYTPKYVPVDFYVNGQYWGNYLLAQQVRIGETRVDIDELGPEDINGLDITGGYLLSMEPDKDDPEENVIKTSRNVNFLVESPSFAPEEGEDPSDIAPAEQYAYISGFLQELEDAIFSDDSTDDTGSTCSSYMDLRSAARYWWVQEFTRNIDAFRTTSTYLYKKRDTDDTAEGKGKLYWGPLWDFDCCCLRGRERGFTEEMKWLDWLRLYDDEYQQELIAGWNDYDRILKDITEENGVLDRYAEEIRTSWKANYILWNKAAVPEESEEKFEKAITSLKSFLNKRRAWIKAHLEEVCVGYINPDQTPEPRIPLIPQTPETTVSITDAEKSSPVTKAVNPLKIKGKTVKVSYAKVKKKTLKLKASRLIRFIRKGQGKKSYRIVKVTGKKYRKFFTLNHKTGKLKIKKGLPKGRYKIKVKVRVSGNAKYKATAKTVIIIVQVKK